MGIKKNYRTVNSLPQSFYNSLTKAVEIVNDGGVDKFGFAMTILTQHNAEMPIFTSGVLSVGAVTVFNVTFAKEATNGVLPISKVAYADIKVKAVGANPVDFLLTNVLSFSYDTTKNALVASVAVKNLGGRDLNLSSLTVEALIMGYTEERYGQITV